MDGTRVTQQDIADRLGINRSTVSLVFKNHPAVAETTKQRVRQVAAELNYTPDPMLTALAAYRHRRRRATFHGTLAWLVNGRADFDWKGNRHYGQYFAGAKSRAHRHGYQVDVLDLNLRGMTAPRLAAIMQARNIPGILLCPQPQNMKELSFDWEHFSLVTFGHSLVSPRLNMVTAAHFHAVRRCLRLAAERGYRRVGLAIARVDDARVDDAYVSAYLGQEYLEKQRVEIPPFFGGFDTWKKGGPLAAWLDTHRPDGLVTNNFRILPVLRHLGWRSPEDIGVACASMPGPDTSLSGIVEDSFHIGEVAVDFLVGLVQHGIRGVPAQPQRIHVEGLWNAGRSLRP